MTKLFPFDDKLLNYLSFLNLSTFNYQDWNILTERFVNIIPSEIFTKFTKELQMFELELKSNKVKLIVNKNLIKFYRHEKIKSNFQTLCQLANSLLCLPFSNAEIERTFSQFKLTKSQLRTPLSDDTVEGLMIWKMTTLMLVLILRMQNKHPQNIRMLIRIHQTFICHNSRK